MNTIYSSFYGILIMICSQTGFEINYKTILILFIMIAVIMSLTIFVAKKIRNNRDNDEEAY